MRAIKEVTVWTGNARRFESAVAAEGFRRAAQGARVLLVQLLRGGIDQGPMRPQQLLEHLEWLRPDVPRIIDSSGSGSERAAVASLWTHVLTRLHECDLLILDEAGLAVQWGFIQESQLLELVENRPSQLEMILTGSGVPESVAALADCWTTSRQDMPGMGACIYQFASAVVGTGR